MSKILEKLKQNLGTNRVQTNISLANYSTYKVGGNAKFFLKAQTVEDIITAVKTATELKIPYFILGGGSNILVSEHGFNGLVIKNDSSEIKIIKQIGKVTQGKTDISQALVEANSGARMNQLVRFTCDRGWGGLEWHLGLPGTVGGALYMNSKWTKPVKYVGDVLYQAKILDKKNQIRLVDQKYFQFGYDQSILQKTHEVVLSAIFLLSKQPTKLLWQRAHKSIAYRQHTQPMGKASAGCVFRNISLADAIRIGTPNHTKSAGYLLDQVGLKNYSINKARFSEKHANFIINDGGAHASDINALIKEAKKRVKNKFGVRIKPEIVLLGNFN